jgi:hypothetical protein
MGGRRETGKIQQVGIQTPQPYRDHVRQAQGLEAGRNML